MLIIPLLFALAQPALATKPCSPDTWFGNPNRTSAEWTQAAGWVAVGKVTARKELHTPFPNCALADKTKCEMQDRTVVTLKVKRWEKGEAGSAKPLTLGAGWCAPAPPKKAGGTYRFYGRDADTYLYFEKIPK